MLEKCREKNIADDLRQQDITRPWQFTRQSKDIIAATGVAEYLTHDELGNVVGEAAGTLKQGGVLAFTFLPAAEGAPLSRPDEQQQHQLSYIQKLYKENGMDFQAAVPFDAYCADDGSVIRHVLALGVKK